MAETNIFQRVETSYDLDRMRRTRIISVGCGGASSFLQDMARSGVGEFVLIDPDVVEEANIGTQHVYLDDIGRPKVDCVADRILQINPEARVDAYQKPLDEFTDNRLAWLTDAPLFFPWHGGASGIKVNPEPLITLLCGLTDNFYAQARVNRLALHLGTPSLCAQLYQYGHAAEITCTYPGSTPACHRCILSPRYKAYLELGYQNSVTSVGASIFATQRLNALKGMIALALLHHGTNHPVWGEVVSRIGNRTLIQLRMHPDVPLKIFQRVFTDHEHCFMDEAVWLKQEPDPDCPDCHGTGNLLDVKGSFTDTRMMADQAHNTGE